MKYTLASSDVIDAIEDGIKTADLSDFFEITEDFEPREFALRRC